VKQEEDRSSSFIYIILIIAGYILPVLFLWIPSMMLDLIQITAMKVFVIAALLWIIVAIKNKIKVSIILLLIVWAFFFVSWAILGTGYLAARSHGRLALCEQKLKTLGSLTEVYIKNHKGTYPDKINLVTDDEKLLLCNLSKKPYSYLYNSNNHNFTIYCTGNDIHRHAGTMDMLGSENFPQYSQKNGIIYK
jgi:hypothetical protein